MNPKFFQVKHNEIIYQHFLEKGQPKKSAFVNTDS